jgi:hypothetical protein
MQPDNDPTWWRTLLSKVVEQFPVIVVLMIIAYLQQQQIMVLVEKCILISPR